MKAKEILSWLKGAAMAEAIYAWKKARGMDGNHVKVLEVVDQYDLQDKEKKS